MGFVCFLCVSSVAVKSGEEGSHLKCPRYDLISHPNVHLARTVTF